MTIAKQLGNSAIRRLYFEDTEGFDIELGTLAFYLGMDCGRLAEMLASGAQFAHRGWIFYGF